MGKVRAFNGPFGIGVASHGRGAPTLSTDNVQFANETEPRPG